MIYLRVLVVSPLAGLFGQLWLRVSNSCSWSAEVPEVCDWASILDRDWSMLSSELEDGSCKYFSGTYPTCPAPFLA